MSKEKKKRRKERKKRIEGVMLLIKLSLPRSHLHNAALTTRSFNIVHDENCRRTP